MRTLTADLFITLDGFAKGEGWPAYFGYFGPDLERWIAEQSAMPHVLLMGRVTYELMAGMSQPNADEPMNIRPKVVVSKTLKAPLAWANSTLVTSSDEIRTLKQQSGDPLRTIGSLSLVRNLMQLGLVDRVRLMVFPLILGKTGSEPLFAQFPDIKLELVESQVLDARLLALEYHPVMGSGKQT